ncbi:NAD(P)-binding domain-containing protein [Microbacterium sp. A8/3-1]|uniref:NAD(P)-binding domain-containing protein n=1 Tax=Microbacterium sp. A8/3-1 TaxID=3160749 RepID=A0AAU7W4U2_9MICO
METSSIDVRYPRIGAVGLGRMGSPIEAILSHTLTVRAFDIDAKREAVIPGIGCASSLSDLTTAIDVLVTVLPGPEELCQCMTDAFPALLPGTLWLDFTSGDPAVSRVLGEEAERRGIELVSAPMAGSVAEAAAGELVFFTSGTHGAVARALPILQALSGEDGVRRAGSRVEDAQIVKLLANGLWFANAVATSEALLIGQGLGLATADLHSLLQGSADGSRFLDEHLVRLLDGDYLETLGIVRVVEELNTIRTMSEAAGVTTPLLNTSRQLHHAAFDRFGPAIGELLAVKLLEEAAGRPLRR